MSKSFKVADVAKHNKGDDLYIIVDEDVYDLTTFQDERKQASKQEDPPLVSISVESLLIILSQILAARRVRFSTLRPPPCNTNFVIKSSKESPAKTRANSSGSVSSQLVRYWITADYSLQISQRGHPQEVQRKAAGRITGQQEARASPHASAITTRSKEGEGGTTGRVRCHCSSSGPCCSRGG